MANVSPVTSMPTFGFVTYLLGCVVFIYARESYSRLFLSNHNKREVVLPTLKAIGTELKPGWRNIISHFDSETESCDKVNVNTDEAGSSTSRDGVTASVE